MARFDTLVSWSYSTVTAWRWLERIKPHFCSDSQTKRTRACDSFACHALSLQSNAATSPATTTATSRRKPHCIYSPDYVAGLLYRHLSTAQNLNQLDMSSIVLSPDSPPTTLDIRQRGSFLTQTNTVHQLAIIAQVCRVRASGQMD